MELRCLHKLHGIALDGHTVQVKCSSRFCGARPGVVILHTFDLATQTMKTTAYKDAAKRGNRHAAEHSAAVRTA